MSQSRSLRCNLKSDAKCAVAATRQSDLSATNSCESGVGGHSGGPSAAADDSCRAPLLLPGVSCRLADALSRGIPVVVAGDQQT